MSSNNGLVYVPEELHQHEALLDQYPTSVFKPCIRDKDGKVIFEKEVIFPSFFDETNVTVVADKYLANPGKEKEEFSLREMVNRVSGTLYQWAVEQEYFPKSNKELTFLTDSFCEEITNPFINKAYFYTVLALGQYTQLMSFNSPVYFNIGLREHPQLSACFILNIEDNMGSIAEWWRTESFIFKEGSGSGANLSKIRSTYEEVSGGGKASGPISFAQVSDVCANVIKSGGKLRRAAKLGRIDISHPNCLDVVECKDDEEEKMRILRAAGFKSKNGKDLSSEVFFQNMNLSIGVTDDFMNAVIHNETWSTREVTTGKIVKTYSAREMLMSIAKHAWSTGDPGLQFHDTINYVNPCKKDGVIDSSNPCVIGETILRSPEGDISIKELVDSGRTEIPVYCCDPQTGEIHIRMGRNPRKTGENRPVYKVTYSKGRGGIHSITTTENHKFLDSDGNEIECKDLSFKTKSKTRLMPFNKLIESYKTSGGKEAFIYNRSVKIKESHLVLNWKHNEKIKFGRSANEFVAHHIDGNHLNNHPNNLEKLSNSEHSTGHSTGENNARYGVEVSEETRLRMSNSRNHHFKEIGVIYNGICDVCGSMFETSKSYVKHGNFCSLECKVKHQNEQRHQRCLDWIESVKHNCPYCGVLVLSNAVTCGSDKCIIDAYRSGSDYDNVSYDRSRAAIAAIRSQSLKLGASLLFEGYDISSALLWDEALHYDLETFEGNKRISSKTIIKYWGNWSAFVSDVETHNHIVLNVEYVGTADVYNITVDEFHTVAWGEIITKNCGEYMFLPNTSCNLAAINLIKMFSFSDSLKRITFDHQMLIGLVRTMVIAQDTIIDKAKYPTKEITERTRHYRSLGLGISNLHGLLMYLGLPYDSPEGRILGGSLMAIINGFAVLTSMDIAKVKGPGKWYKKNKKSFQDTLRYHFKNVNETCKEASELEILTCPQISSHKRIELIKNVSTYAQGIWDYISDNINEPVRNAQFTLIAPTGTTGHLMGVATFGLEAEFNLVTSKRLADSNDARINLVNRVVEDSLVNLGYSKADIKEIVTYLTVKNQPIEKCPLVEPHHYAIFDTAVRHPEGTRSISALGHLKMMGEMQKHISGAISKTINMDNDATVEDIYDVFINSWELGLKGITIYRDGSKDVQVLNTITEVKEAVIAPSIGCVPIRTKLSPCRRGKTWEAMIGGAMRLYLRSGEYSDGNLGEVFTTIANDGTTISGLTNIISLLLSLMLQYNIPKVEIFKKLKGKSFAPQGFVSDNPNIKSCTSIADFMAHQLALEYCTPEELVELGYSAEKIDTIQKNNIIRGQITGNICSVCGELTQRVGTCDVCQECGTSSGVCG